MVKGQKKKKNYYESKCPPNSESNTNETITTDIIHNSSLHHNFLTRVVSREDNVDHKIHGAHCSDQPKVVVEVAAVEIASRNPTGAATRPCDGGDNGDDQRVDVIAERDREEGERRAHAPHRLRRLTVEELKLRDPAEHVGARQD